MRHSLFLILFFILAAQSAYARSFVYSQNIFPAGDGIAEYELDEMGTIKVLSIEPEIIPGSALSALASRPAPLGGRAVLVTADTSGGGLYTFLVRADGSLEAGKGSPCAAGPGIISLAWSPSGHYLYALQESGRIRLFRSWSNGALVEKAADAVESDSGARSISMDPLGSYLISADPGQGSLRVFRRGLGGRLKQVFHRENDDWKGVSATVLSPDGQHVYGIGGHRIIGLELDRESGSLAPLSGFPMELGSSAQVGLMAGQCGKFLFLAQGVSDQVSAWTRNWMSGVLSPAPDSPVSAPRGPAGLALDSSGRYLIVTDVKSRRLRTFWIDPSSGSLDPVGMVMTPGAAPRSVVAVPAPSLARSS